MQCSVLYLVCSFPHSAQAYGNIRSGIYSTLTSPSHFVLMKALSKAHQGNNRHRITAGKLHHYTSLKTNNNAARHAGSPELDLICVFRCFWRLSCLAFQWGWQCRALINRLAVIYRLLNLCQDRSLSLFNLGGWELPFSAVYSYRRKHM